jgi:SET domain
MLKIVNDLIMGRCLIATQDIPENTVVEMSELLVLSENDTVAVNKTDLKYYTFKYNQFQDCLCLGLGEIFNHDRDANVTYNLIRRDDRSMMQFKTTKAIKQGGQLFINYGQDINVDFEEYLNKNLLG